MPFLCAGSSAGSAASVAARIAPWSLCEDTGGSCRAPAIANGEKPAGLSIAWGGSLLELRLGNLLQHDLEACPTASCCQCSPGKLPDLGRAAFMHSVTATTCPGPREELQMCCGSCCLAAAAPYRDCISA